MKKSVKISIASIVTIIVLVAAAVIISYYVLNSYVPEYSGAIKVRQISSDVKVYRDNYGVPYILAETGDDAAFALGYLHAQERLFQMDLARRAGEGRLSEIFGSRTVLYDKMFRTLGLYKSVQDNYEKLNPVTRQLLESYCNGVNYFIDNCGGKYSVEFDVLGYKPYKWKPEHSLVMAKLMAFELNLSWWSDIAFTHLLQKFDREKVLEIIPGYPENAPTIIPEGLGNYPRVSLDLIKTDRSFRKFMGFTGTHIGSNNWVVNGNKSVSGKPLIANDPHLAFQAPARWYMAVIKSDSWNVEGFTIPGLPAVVIGKNQDISWVLTNVMADDADFYIEKFDSTGTKYLFNGEWRDLSVRTDTIIVKDSADVPFLIESTHRGPVVSNVHPYQELFPNDEQGKANLSMRWTAFEFSDELNGIIGVNKAHNWKEFLAGVKNFTVPGQNFVYADNKGNIGYVCAAKLPIRKNLSPTMVFDGTTDKYDWVGFVPFDEMPKMFNPKTDYIASANNKTVRDFKYHISNIWEPPSRIDRIKEVLESKQKLNIEDYEKLQNDFYSHYAKKITPFILNAFKKAQIKDPNLETALELLEKWNFEMEELSQTPAIFNVFLVKLLHNIFVDEMGEELFNEYVFLANIPYRIIFELFEKGKSSWFDNIKTEQVENRDDIIRKSLADALDYLEEKFGSDPALWQWGEIHKVEFKHFFGGVNALVDRLVNIGPFPIGGDGTTVFNTEYTFTKPYQNNLGPSMRYIYDFDKSNQFYFILPTGQSGHIMSGHYDDMTGMWRKGKYIKINTGRNFIENSDYDLLIMQK